MIDIDQCRLIQLPKVPDLRGNLTFLEGDRHIPFAIKRADWVYSVPGGETHGGHAHKELQEFVVALSGSFDVVLHNSRTSRLVSLNRAYLGLYIPKMIWRELTNFSTNAVCLILSSMPYSEADHMRNYSEYCTYQRASSAETSK